MGRREGTSGEGASRPSPLLYVTSCSPKDSAQWRRRVLRALTPQPKMRVSCKIKLLMKKGRATHTQKNGNKIHIFLLPEEIKLVKRFWSVCCYVSFLTLFHAGQPEKAHSHMCNFCGNQNTPIARVCACVLKRSECIVESASPLNLLARCLSSLPPPLKAQFTVWWMGVAAIE